MLLRPQHTPLTNAIIISKHLPALKVKAGKIAFTDLRADDSVLLPASPPLPWKPSPVYPLGEGSWLETGGLSQSAAKCPTRATKRCKASLSPIKLCKRAMACRAEGHCFCPMES